MKQIKNEHGVVLRDLDMIIGSTVRTDPRMFWNVLEFEYFI